MGGNTFMPRFRNLKKDEKRNFIKGYCVRIGSGGGATPEMFAAVRRRAAEEARQLRRFLRHRGHLRRARRALRKSRPHQ